MTDLVTFLRARIDEDEAAAKAATPGPWTAEPYVYSPDGPYEMEVRAAGATVVSHQPHEGGGIHHDPDAEHIARHDPARVLADVEAARRIVELHLSWAHDPVGTDRYADRYCQTCSDSDTSWWNDKEPPQWPCPTLRLLAVPFADHPEYDQVWRP